MLENVNKYKYMQEDYKEYIELWIHEIKIPIATSKMIIENNKILSNIILITGFIGCIGGLFVHGLLCIQAIIYKRITDNGKTNFEIADNTLEGLYKAIMFPFFLLYCILMIADICVVIAVLRCTKIYGFVKFNSIFNYRCSF